MSLGLWHNFGDDRPLENIRAILRRAFDLGITHFDLANNYGTPYGSGERNFGRVMREILSRCRQPGRPGVQVALLREVGGPPGRRQVGVACRGRVAGHLQQVRADRLQPVVRGDPLVGLQAREQMEPGLRARCAPPGARR